MQMMRGRTQGLLAMARGSLIISIGVPPLLLAPGGGSRRQLHILPEGQRVWVPESFNGASGFGMNAERFFVGSEVEDAFEFFKKNHLLHPVPNDRLFSPHLSYPHFTEDGGNKFILSGLHVIDGSHDWGLSTKGLFTRENVVLLPRSMVLGLKQINATGVIVPGGVNQLPVKERAENYKEYAAFLEDLVDKCQGPVAPHVMPPLLKDITRLANEMITNEKLVEILRYYPAVMLLQHKAVFYRRVYNIHERLHLIFLHGLPAAGVVTSGKVSDVKVLQNNLLNYVPYTTAGKHLWGDMARRNFEVFNVFMSVTAMKQNDAAGLIRVLRVIASHPFGPDMAMLMRELEQVEKDAKAGNLLTQRAQGLAIRACSSTLQTVPPTCREVLRLTDGTYPSYPTEVTIGFLECGVHGWLDMPALVRPLR